MGGKFCSGTFISNSGHVITAHHCLQGCVNSGIDERIAAEMRWHIRDPKGQPREFSQDQYEAYLKRTRVGDHSFTYMRFDKSSQGAECVARIDGRETKLIYLGGGAGSLWPFSLEKLEARELVDDWLKFVSEGYGPGGDFAVFKANIESSPCLPLSKTSVRPGEQLRVLSATMQSGYTSKEERLGQTAFFSEGVESSSVRGLQRHDLPLSVFRHGEFVAEAGSSGSAVIGEDETIKGVLTQGMDQYKYGKHVDTYSSFLDITMVRKFLVENWNIEIPDCHPQ